MVDLWLVIIIAWLVLVLWISYELGKWMVKNDVQFQKRKKVK